MAPDFEREKAFLILRECLEEDAFSNLAIKGEKVTDFVTAAVYGTITYCYSIDFMIRLASHRDVADMDPDTRTIVRLGAWQILFSRKVPDYAAVDSSVSLARRYCRSSAGFVNAVLHKLSALEMPKRNIDSYRPEVAVSLPPEIWGIFKKDYGRERAFSICKAFLSPPPMTIRFDSRVTGAEEIMHILEKQGVTATAASFMDCALTVKTSDVPIDETEAFTDGRIIVQGESAMLASVIASPSRGMRILDSCSAPGGKTTHLAQLTGDDCHIDALDINESRVRLIEQNAGRMGLRSINAIQGDATSYRAESLYDLVTADVPCSGLGLISRKPDIRQHLSYGRIKELISIQREILFNAGQNVRPGGVLVYSTCTVNKMENEEQVSFFLEKNTDFEAENIQPYLPPRLLERMDEKRMEQAKKGYITLLPDTDGCDGFFIARMRRR